MEIHRPNRTAAFTQGLQHPHGIEEFQGAGVQPQRPGPGPALRQAVNDAAGNAAAQQIDAQGQAGGAGADDQYFGLT